MVAIDRASLPDRRAAPPRLCVDPDRQKAMGDAGRAEVTNVGTAPVTVTDAAGDGGLENRDRSCEGGKK